MRPIRQAAKIFLKLLLIMQPGIIFSQGLNIQEVVPNSPNAAELGKYGSVPVGLFTGTVQQNIPLFEFKTRSLSVPVSLSYSSNGLIVDKMASWVGLDWSLNAGGVITLSVRGKADNSQNRASIPSDFNSGHDYLLNFVNTYYGYADFQPDIFSYNFNGNSGRFFVKDDMHSVAFIPYQNLKVEAAGGDDNLLRSNGFILTSTDGIKYKFSSSNSEITSTSTQVYINSWYLTSIIHPDGDSIHFYYSTLQTGDYVSGATQQVLRNVHTDYGEGGICPPAFCPTDQGTPQSVYISVSVIYLDSAYAPGYGTVVFQRSGNRSDYQLGKKLDRIIVKDNNQQQIKVIDLKYHFPVNWSQYGTIPLFSSLNDIRYRMFLDTVIIKSSQAVPIEKYTFDYLGLDSLPSRLSFAQDHWGYFNGAANNDLVPALDPQDSYAQYFAGVGGNRAPNGVYSKVSLLKKITYPTGGYSLMEYEPHVSTSGQVGGCRIKKVSTYTTQGSIPQVTKYIYNPGQAFGLPTYFTTFKTTAECTNCVTGHCTTASMSSSSLTSLFNNDQYQISYPVVKTYYGENYENGAEEHQFQSASNAPGTPIFGGIIQPMPYTNTGWYTGREIINTTYKKDSLGHLQAIKSVQFNYADTDSRNKVVQICLGMNRRSNKEYCVANWDQLTEYDLVQYTLYSIWSKLVSKTETEYFDSGNSTVTTNYYYDNPTHALVTMEYFIDSRGDTIKKKYYYPQDYDTTGFSRLIVKFITGKPVDTRSYINNKITSCEQNKYNNYGQITDFYKGEITNNTADILFNKSSAYTATHRATYSYNANKNLISIAPDKDVKTSFIWGYGNNLPVAKVVNAGGSDIAYGGFEDRITTGNWNLSAATFSYASGSAARGKNYILWSSGSISGPALNSSTKYRLRFYARSSVSSSVTLAGIGTIAITGDNQFHLYETSFQSRTSITLTTSSGISLDEITLCPQISMMTTYIYDPLVGMRSSTDANEVTTWYEYDTFGRLYRIRDKDRNILKQYDYHYKQ